MGMPPNLPSSDSGSLESESELADPGVAHLVPYTAAGAQQGGLQCHLAHGEEHSGD
jgi:hypothetical protein